MDAIIKNASNYLLDDGIVVINDMVSDVKADIETKKYVYERMSFPFLVNISSYKNILESNNFKILKFEELNKHFARSYQILAERGHKNGFDELAFKYEKTVESIQRNEYGMVNIIAQKMKQSNL